MTQAGYSQTVRPSGCMTMLPGEVDTVLFEDTYGR
jgi:hypothetical protein